MQGLGAKIPASLTENGAEDNSLRYWVLHDMPSVSHAAAGISLVDTGWFCPPEGFAHDAEIIPCGLI